MPSTQELIIAANRAKQAGHMEAYAALHQAVIDSYGKHDPTEGMGTGQKLLAGIGQGMTNIGRQAGNIVGMIPDEQMAEYAGRDKALLDTGAGKAGAFIGEMAATAPLGGVVAGGARRLGAGLIRAGLAEGAAQGALTAGPGNRAGGAVGGAAFGGLLPGGARVLQRLGAPLRATKSARELLARDVRLTPGELNPTGRLNQWEQGLQSSPFGGTTITNARTNTVRDWQRAAGREAAAPGEVGAVTSRDGARMIEQLEGGYGRGYDDAVGQYTSLRPEIHNTTANVPLHTTNTARGQRGAMVEAVNARYPGRMIKPDEQRTVLHSLNRELSGLPRGSVTGSELQQVRTNIRRMARDTDEAGERTLLRGGERKISDALQSQIAPEDFAKLQALDANYGNFKVVQDAVRKGGLRVGGFTPNDLGLAVRTATDLGEFARGGGGPLRRLARAGAEVFERRVQPTGERQVMTGIFGRLVTPAVGVALAGATKLNPNALVGNTARQRALRGVLRRVRRGNRSNLQAGQSALTNAMIQANEE